MPEYDLVATSPVAGYERGQRITDDALIADILADERATHVVKVARPEPVPKKGAKPDAGKSDAATA